MAFIQDSTGAALGDLIEALGKGQPGGGSSSAGGGIIITAQQLRVPQAGEKPAGSAPGGRMYVGGPWWPGWPKPPPEQPEWPEQPEEPVLPPAPPAPPPALPPPPAPAPAPALPPAPAPAPAPAAPGAVASVAGEGKHVKHFLMLVRNNPINYAKLMALSRMQTFLVK